MMGKGLTKTGSMVVVACGATLIALPLIYIAFNRQQEAKTALGIKPPRIEARLSYRWVRSKDDAHMIYTIDNRRSTGWLEKVEFGPIRVGKVAPISVPTLGRVRPGVMKEVVLIFPKLAKGTYLGYASCTWRSGTDWSTQRATTFWVP